MGRKIVNYIFVKFNLKKVNTVRVPTSVSLSLTVRKFFCLLAGVESHVHVLLPGPGTRYPVGGQRLAAQGRHRVSGVRGTVRRRRRRKRRRR